MDLAPGLVQFPWLNGGHAVRVPALTGEEIATLALHEAALVTNAGLKDDLPSAQREALQQHVELLWLAEALRTRFHHVDEAITRDKILKRPMPELLKVVEALKRADDANYPR